MTSTIPMLDLAREHAQIAAEVQQAWAETMREMHLLNGPQAAAFEREIAAYLGVAHARGTSSGTDALILGLAALEIGRGDRVVLPANAFIAALEAVHHVGATPVLSTSRPTASAPTSTPIAAALPARAVLVVHLYGCALALDDLCARCDASGAVLIEDGSHAHGARRGGRFTGTFGDGRLLQRRRREEPRRVRRCRLRHHRRRGCWRSRSACCSGTGNAARTSTCATGGTSVSMSCRPPSCASSCARLEARNQRRRDIAAFYSERLAPLGIRAPRVDADEVPVYHQYVVRTERRDELQRHLKSRGVETGIHYPVPLHRQAAWAARVRRRCALPARRALGGGGPFAAGLPRPDRRGG